jgi:anion-transporting  ArsA/GET3 family ATPase
MTTGARSSTREQRLIAKRLLIVSGKGGVGKSTVAAALGMAAVRRGLRTVVVEIAGRRDVAGMLGRKAGERNGEAEVYPGMYHLTVDRRFALVEYLRDEVPGPLPATVLARSRTFRLFVDATPGMGDLLTIGKVWELTQRPRHRPGALEYDLVVLDGPASGQLVGMLAAPRTFSSIARVGPVARQAAAIDRTLSDHDSVSVVAVATPEQMAVSETLDLCTAMRREFGIEPGAVVVNQIFRSTLIAGDAIALATAPDDPAVGSAQWLDRRATAQRDQLVPLQEGLAGVCCMMVPFVFATDSSESQVEQLAGHLERIL